MCTDRHRERSPSVVGFHANARGALRLALLALVLLAPRAANAQDRADAPRIVHRAGDRLYVASADSGSIAPGMTVRVFDREREIAVGQVTGVLDGVLASVRLTRGLIDSDARLERLHLVLEPAPLLAPLSLRIGLPAPGRGGLAASCADARLDLAALPRAYRAETLGVETYRLLAADSVQSVPAWPETLFVRMFGDRADEEIALERGELDVAVFWPGEPSARLRQEASGYETLHGNRARGVLAAIAPPDSSLALALAPDMAALNTQMFGGDLGPWPAPAAGGGAAARELRGNRIVVDRTLPGQGQIARWFDRRRGPQARTNDRKLVLTLLDAPGAPADSLAAAWRTEGVHPLFRLRCPEICKQDLAPVVRALGVDALANLLRCGAGGSAP